jgi:4-alpha-glucanotransferase
MVAIASAALLSTADRAARERLREGLLDCASEVLFFEVPGSDETLFHPRCSMHMTRSFQELDPEVKRLLDDLYVDYFHRRQEDFWQARGYEKLPVMRRASTMLLCGEDLGMVPDCVPGVMRELGILSLEIQRMPKSSKVEFADPARAPYLSVVSPSTHDMPTLRGWWREDQEATGHFAWQIPQPMQRSSTTTGRRKRIFAPCASIPSASSKTMAFSGTGQCSSHTMQLRRPLQGMQRPRFT